MAAHDIDVPTATTHTANFRSAHGNLSRGGRIHKSQIQAILSQSGCQELRCYFSVPDTSEPNDLHIIFVGVDGSGNDMIGTGAVLKDSVTVCPPNCGSFNTIHNFGGV